MINKNVAFWGQTLMWILLAFLMSVFMYEHISSHYIFWKDPTIWFFPILISKSYINWDLSRIVAHLLNDAPLLLWMQMTSNIKILAYVFSATVWFWYFVSFLFSSLYILKRDERYLLVLFPIILCASIKAFLYTEIHFIAILGLPALLLLLSEKDKSTVRHIFLSILLIALGFTHQSVIFYYASVILFLLISKNIKIFPGLTRIFPLLISLAMLIYNLLVIFKPNDEVCDACISDFRTTLFYIGGYWSVWVFLAFFVPLFYLSRKGYKFLIPFLALYGYFYSVSLQKYNYTELFVQWNGRIHIILIFSIMCFLVLLLKFLSKINLLKRINALTPIFCCLSIVSSFSYINVWKDIKMDLSSVSNRVDENKPLVMLTLSNPDFKMAPVNYNAVLTARNIQDLSLFFQLVEGKQVIHRLIVRDNDYKNTQEAFDRLARLEALGITFSESLSDCIEEFEAHLKDASCVLNF